MYWIKGTEDNMNALYKLYCRCYQKVMYIAEFMLPWRVPEQISGEGSLSRLPAFAKEHGFKSALLVTDEVLMKLGMAQPIIDGFAKEGLSLTIYDKVVPNPTVNNIAEGLKLYNDNNCDVIIALGGGSPMDCAKGIGARVARPRKPISKMKGVLKVMKKLPPLVAIPTTSGTGSEATLAAVISNPETHEKYPINDPVLIPHYAVMDPLLTVGLPKHITSTTGMDALTHAVEAYIGSSNTRNTKKYAIEATQLIFKYLYRAYENGGDIEARSNMQKASLLARQLRHPAPCPRGIRQQGVEEARPARRCRRHQGQGRRGKGESLHQSHPRHERRHGHPRKNPGQVDHQGGRPPHHDHPRSQGSQPALPRSRHLGEGRDGGDVPHHNVKAHYLAICFVSPDFQTSHVRKVHHES